MRIATATVLLFVIGLSHAGDYPHPVQSFDFDSQRQELSMAYMDVMPDVEPRGTFVLLHGKNFNGAYWHQTIDFLTERGFRVVVPDQIGFGRSSMPAHYQFTFDQLAANTRALLAHLDVSAAHVIGHSMGGMLATRFALQYPEFADQLVLLNPIGLEDWRAMGVPYVPIERIYRAELQKDFESIRAYQRASYYDGDWKERYEPWARMLAEAYEGDEGERFAWNMALTADMVLSQPVVYQFDQLAVPTVLMIGLRDRTAIGRNLVDEALAEKMGDYPALTEKVAGMIPDVEVVRFEGIGHLPHIEAPEAYLEALGDVIPDGRVVE
ncbi:MULTISPECIES: alpha/beta fold hydrolase [unclassified Wenzhouxiangella]|uniref:alpha/beta fold hydrolase n=1 Tax=unclassified Wenzhouxiangella TaxID=2613841 RepID=UPI000E325224|nr:MULTISPECIES: alpha/beta hydrolase [unclassified Wenzhouxiangella]RFF26883.1 alpha/beta hydrolase [Wenzhouxiangella sp. 15181]RFP68463.1 alpha/beta hydrolase [Wenzhouxiangella sp. 15190]